MKRILMAAALAFGGCTPEPNVDANTRAAGMNITYDCARVGCGKVQTAQVHDARPQCCGLAMRPR